MAKQKEEVMTVKGCPRQAQEQSSLSSERKGEPRRTPAIHPLAALSDPSFLHVFRVRKRHSGHEPHGGASHVFYLTQFPLPLHLRICVFVDTGLT